MDKYPSNKIIFNKRLDNIVTEVEIDVLLAVYPKKEKATRILKQFKNNSASDFDVNFQLYKPITAIDTKKINFDIGPRIFFRRSQIYELAFRNPYRIHNPKWEPPI
ncbi:hypothetical protein bcgnr5372_38660 [Bacillus luti]|nr:hypothetical protein [Bacillus cereus]HDR8327248.1 hypothetical protein [Bacillus cereus]HDR8336438.1 hypothetical protein [Bacillus cereus]